MSKLNCVSDPEQTDSVNITEKIEILYTEDEKIKTVGEMLSNDSSRTILKLLFDDVMTANQIAQKTGIQLSLVIYHLKKMQDMNIIKIAKVEKNSKAQDMKYYAVDKFAIVILSSKVSEKVKKSKSLVNSINRIYRFAAIGVAALSSWIIMQYTQNLEVSPPPSGPNVPGLPGPPPVGAPGIPETLFLSTIITLVVIITGLIIERVLKAYKR